MPSLTFCSGVHECPNLRTIGRSDQAWIHECRVTDEYIEDIERCPLGKVSYLKPKGMA